MNEVITILTSRSGNQIAKAFVGLEYEPQRFSIGRSFTAHEEQVSDLRSLSRILQKLENETTKPSSWRWPTLSKTKLRQPIVEVTNWSADESSWLHGPAI